MILAGNTDVMVGNANSTVLNTDVMVLIIEFTPIHSLGITLGVEALSVFFTVVSFFYTIVSFVRLLGVVGHSGIIIRYT